MTRGNQRDLARAKNQKKQQELGKKKAQAEEGLTLEQRRERDANLLREKQAKKAAEAAAAQKPSTSK